MNSETLKLIFTFLTGVGSAIIVAWLGVKLERKKKENEKRQEFKEVRYKAVILLMLASFNFEKDKSSLHAHGRTDLNELKDLLDELEVEWKNMILYANDKVFKSMGEFVIKPTQENFWKTALEMRRDLYGIQTKLSLEDFIEKATKK